ncbi:MAG: hypothetical protein ACRDIZ_09465 [Actinomycetota bacterium]
MRDFFDQIEAAVDARLYYVSLMCALAIPDVCGGMEAEDGQATKARYIEWFDRHMGQLYAGTLSGEDCYLLRCAMLHQGSLRHPKATYERVIFLEPGTGPILHMNVVMDALNIDASIFCRDMIEAGREWLAQAEQSEAYKRNYDKFLKRHPEGLRPYIVGVPVIG